MTEANSCAGRYARRMRYPGENSAGRAPGRRQNPSGRAGLPEERQVPGGPGAPRGDAALFTPGYAGGRAPGRDSGREPVPAGRGRYGSGGAAAGKGPIRGFPPAPGQPPPLYPPGQFAAWNRLPDGGNGYDSDGSDTWLAGYAEPTAVAGYPGASPAGAALADAGYSDDGYADASYADAGPGYADAGQAGPDQPEPGYDETGQGAPGPAPFEAGFVDPAYASAGYSDPGYSALAVSDPSADVTSTQTWGAVDGSAPASHWSDLAADERWPPPDTNPGAHPAAPRGETDDRGQADSIPGPFDRAAPGPFDRAATGSNPRVTTGPNPRVTTGPNPRVTTGPGRGAGTRRRGTRGRARPRGSKRRVRALLACVLALLVVIGATYFWFARSHNHATTTANSQHPKASARPSPRDPSPSPSPSLGPWGHIESRALDPAPLTLAELFPAQFANAGLTYTRTVDKAKAHCSAALIGSQLITAVSHAGCTQAMRASYLSADHKLMGTIGVLNLVTATAAEKAGKAAGPAEFIAQLPAAKGPTKNLTKGTGFEAAEVKGHYLVLVWAEFADLRAPKTPAQRADLEAFISLLMQKTANVSLASRMVTGTPAT